MLLGEFDSEFMEDFSVVSLKGTVQSTVTIDDDETENVFVFQEFLQILFFLSLSFNQIRAYLNVELVIAKVKRFVDGLEGFEIDNDLLFSSTIFTEDGTGVQNETIGRGLVVQL